MKGIKFDWVYLWLWLLLLSGSWGVFMGMVWVVWLLWRWGL